MNEIKFRAWDKKKSEILDVMDIDFSGEKVGVCNIPKRMFKDGRLHTIHSIEKDWSEVELMQSTGRTGMNKKGDEVDIFQGDIIQVIEQGHQMGFYVENEYVGVIEYDKGHCGHFLKLIETNFHNEIPDEVDGITIFKGDEEPERYYFNDIDFLVPEDITILGNVYENPELLKEQNK